MSARKSLPLCIPSPPRAVRSAPRRGALRATVGALCRRAKIPVRATSDRPIYVRRGRVSYRTPGYDVVAVPADPRGAEGALRALEVLAHGFHDPLARHCVCGRGYFRAEVH